MYPDESQELLFEANLKVAPGTGCTATRLVLARGVHVAIEGDFQFVVFLCNRDDSALFSLSSGISSCYIKLKPIFNCRHSAFMHIIVLTLPAMNLPAVTQESLLQITAILC